jgi:hypothetical protein
MRDANEQSRALAERLEHEQRAAHEAQSALGAKVRELEDALERERQSAYEQALARAELEARIDSERGEASSAQHEANVHIEELQAALREAQQSACERALEYADVEAQLASERREREQADTRAESARQAQTLTLEAVGELKTVAADQARAVEDAIARCADYDARIAALTASYEQLGDELAQHLSARHALEAQLRDSHAAREHAEARAAEEARARTATEQQLREAHDAREALEAKLAAQAHACSEAERAVREAHAAREDALAQAVAQAQARARADALFREQGRQILNEAQHVAETHAAAITATRAAYEALGSRLRETLAALGSIEEAARSHALVNARLEAHLRQEPGSEENDGAP